MSALPSIADMRRGRPTNPLCARSRHQVRQYPALYCVDPARISFRSHQTSCTRNTCVQRGGTLSKGAGDRFNYGRRLRPAPFCCKLWLAVRDTTHENLIQFLRPQRWCVSLPRLTASCIANRNGPVAPRPSGLRPNEGGGWDGGWHATEQQRPPELGLGCKE
jgi:hypothetical protein